MGKISHQTTSIIIEALGKKYRKETTFTNSNSTKTAGSDEMVVVSGSIQKGNEYESSHQISGNIRRESNRMGSVSSRILVKDREKKKHKFSGIKGNQISLVQISAQNQRKTCPGKNGQCVCKGLHKLARQNNKVVSLSKGSSKAAVLGREKYSFVKSRTSSRAKQ